MIVVTDGRMHLGSFPLDSDALIGEIFPILAVRRSGKKTVSIFPFPANLSALVIFRCSDIEYSCLAASWFASRLAFARGQICPGEFLASATNTPMD